MKYDKRVIPLGFFKRMERYPNFTEVDYHVSMPHGWLSMSTESDDGPIALMTVVGSQIYLQKLTARFTGNPVTLETMEKLSEILPKLKYLRCLAFEFLNSRMSENEIIIFAQTLPQLKSLERLHFKAIQYPNVSEGSIYYLISTISKLPNIKNVEIYFRRYLVRIFHSNSLPRLNIPEEIVQELLNRLQSFENIQCCHTKQSLSFTRTDKNSII